jgi:hypothetical protein
MSRDASTVDLQVGAVVDLAATHGVAVSRPQALLRIDATTRELCADRWSLTPANCAVHAKTHGRQANSVDRSSQGTQRNASA